ncbi:MAG: UvrD-helicase domain-containing protein, partial [Myxococcales bacterium]|nr:UvrD-helicase domain-containing protein [Myxococcales bacterium]
MLVATHPFDPFAVSLHGTVVVEASAGTGKTHAIASLVLRLVVERCIDVDRIAVVTFTRAAAGELRERVRRRLRDALDALEASGGGRSGVRRDGDPELEAWVEGRRRSGTTDRDCARLRRGLRGLDEACVDTIHGFCRRVLRAHGGPEGLLVEGTRLVDPRRLVDELVHDGWLAVLQRETGVHVEEIATASDLGWLRTIGRQVVEDPTLTVEPSAGAPMDATTRWRVAFAHQVRQAAQRRKQALGLRFINDTLHRLHAKLCVVRDEPLRRAIAGAYDAILVDEFQDTDTVQYELFATLAGARPRDLLLVLIGDPRQAIYGFRGANVHAYCWALRQCETQPQTLLVNRRSDPPLVEAVNRLFEAARRPFVTDAIAFRRAQPAPDGRIRLVGGRAGPPLTLFAVRGGGELHVAAACIARAAAWLLEEPAQIADADNRRRAIDAGDLAVLTRTNEQANAVQRALQSLGVPAVHAGEASVLQSTEAEELERIVRALATPDEPRVLYAALATRPFGLNAVELVQARADASKGMEWNGRFRRACALLQSRGPAAAVWTLFREVAAERRLLERPEGARALTNYAHVLELLDTVSRERGLGPQRLVAWLSRARSDPDGLGGLDPELVQLRLESDARAVRVMTIHRAKGLEFPIVVVGWLWTPIGARDRDPVVRYHDPTRDVAPHLDVGSTSIDKHRELAHREALSEALRLAYVALTRARHRCLVGYLEREADPAYDGAPRVRSPETSPLEYLLGHAIAAARSGSQGVDSPEPVTREGLELLARASGSVMGVLDMGEEASPRRGMPHSATRLVAPERTRRVESERNPRTASF